MKMRLFKDAEIKNYYLGLNNLFLFPDVKPVGLLSSGDLNTLIIWCP